MSLFKQTPTQKLKSEIARLRRELVEVCINPDSRESKSIIIHYKMLSAYSKNKTSFNDYLRDIVFSKPKMNTTFYHYEENKSSEPDVTP